MAHHVYCVRSCLSSLELTRIAKTNHGVQLVLVALARLEMDVEALTMRLVSGCRAAAAVHGLAAPTSVPSSSIYLPTALVDIDAFA